MISILMATYQGEQYLTEQLDSIFRQTEQNFHLFIRDDGSTDNTISILTEYRQRYSEKITLVPSKNQRLGIWLSYMSMICNIEDDYIMFCDQDDIWENTKIEYLLTRMYEKETVFGSDKAILIHSDVSIINEKGILLHNSLQKMKRTSFKRYSLNHLLVQNTVLGCTVMYNQALSKFVTSSPEFMVMHDWWLTLIASAFGEIDLVNDCTTQYRWHEDNNQMKRNIRKTEEIKKARKNLIDSREQCENFLLCYRENLSPKQKKICENYILMNYVSKFRRIYIIFRYRFWKSGIIKKIVQIILS